MAHHVFPPAWSATALRLALTLALVLAPGLDLAPAAAAAGVSSDEEMTREEAARAAGRWRPDPAAVWDYQLINPPTAVPAGVKVMIMDLFDTPATTVARFRRQGVRSVCYLNAGAWEDWRPDADDFPAAVLGRDYEGWPGEKWLNIRKISALAPILRARLDLCRRKGFDAVDPDNLNGYENPTGFRLTKDDQIRFNIWLAREAHKRGLSVGLKNASVLAGRLEPHFDFTVVESCVHYGWCRQTRPFRRAGKAIFAVEYTDQDVSLSDLCPAADRHGMTGILKRRNLGTWRRGC